MPRALRAVTETDEPTKSTKPKTVTEAAKGGDHRELLVAMRERIARAVEDDRTMARDLASLTKRLSDVAREIEAIDARDEQEQGSAGVVADEAFDASAV